MEVTLRDLSQEQLNNASKLVLVNEYMMYRKLEPNKYETLCMYCRKKNVVTYKQLREIQHSHYCPDCNEWLHSTTKKTKGRHIDYVEIDELGYKIDVSYDFDNVRVNSYEQFADFNQRNRKSVAIKRGYRLNSSGCIYEWHWQNDGTYTYKYNWKFKNYCWGYDNCLFTMLNGSPLERKEIYKNKCSFINKSNQIKLVIDNRLTPKQAELVKVFDINSIDDFNKYKHLLNDYEFRFHLEDFLRHNLILNIYHLDYLSRTGIDLGKYYHYLNNLKTLGWKYDKPKTKEDFEYRLSKTDNIIATEKDRIIDENINRRFAELPKYESENITISPFKCAHDIRECGKKLHNCIGGYVERYSKGETDLYELKIDDVLTVAIEMKGKDLWQARTDHNGDCPSELMEHINNFILAM